MRHDLCNPTPGPRSCDVQTVVGAMPHTAKQRAQATIERTGVEAP